MRAELAECRAVLQATGACTTLGYGLYPSVTAGRWASLNSELSQERQKIERMARVQVGPGLTTLQAPQPRDTLSPGQTRRTGHPLAGHSHNLRPLSLQKWPS